METFRDYTSFKRLDEVIKDDNEPPEALKSKKGIVDVRLSKLGKMALGCEAEGYTTFMASKRPPVEKKEEAVIPPEGPRINQASFAQSLAPRKNT